MCSDALRAHLLCGLTWETWREGWSTWHLPLWEKTKSAAQPQNTGTRFERNSKPSSPESGRKNATAAPWGFQRTQRCAPGEGLHPQSEADVKTYRQRWGVPAHVGLPELRGCRRGERSKPGRSRSWWHWSESGWSYSWGSAGNLLLGTKEKKERGEEWEQQRVEIHEAVTVFYSPTTHPFHKHTCTRAHEHKHTLPTHGVILQTSQKIGFSGHEKDLWIKNLKPSGRFRLGMARWHRNKVYLWRVLTSMLGCGRKKKRRGPK